MNTIRSIKTECERWNVDILKPGHHKRIERNAAVMEVRGKHKESISKRTETHAGKNKPGVGWQGQDECMDPKWTRRVHRTAMEDGEEKFVMNVKRAALS